MAKRFKEKTKINIKSKIPVHLLLICSIFIIASIGITIALIITNTEPKTNTYIPGNISCEVQDDYSIKNTGNATAYIRADIIANWIDDSKNINAIAPEIQFTLGENWVQNTEDGYYYYKNEVEAEQSTSVLFTNMSTEDAAPSGYTLSVTVLTEAIQGDDGNKAIEDEDAWDVVLEDLI